MSHLNETGSLEGSEPGRNGDEKNELSNSQYITSGTAIQDLLDQASQRIVTDPARADMHRAIYLSVWPLCFAERMEASDA